MRIVLYSLRLAFVQKIIIFETSELLSATKGSITTTKLSGTTQ